MDCRQGWRILGIDPGLNITGYGVIEVAGHRSILVEAGIIRSPAGRPLSTRLLSIHQGMSDIIAALSPNSLALEELYSHYQRPRTAILMGHARGVICLAASQAGLSTYHYAATQVKKILTGNGRAPKLQMQQAIQRELNLPQQPEPADVADALAIALCHQYLAKRDVA